MKTAYIVLKLDESEGLGVLWREGPTIEATSAEAAVRSATIQGAADGTYVAVPARSWKPVTVTTETRSVVKLTEATV